MSGRSKLIDLGKEFPKLTEKEADALICVHPYLDGLTQEAAAHHLGISTVSLRGRLQTAYRKIPWLQEDIRMKRKEQAEVRRRIRNASRMGDMRGIGNDESHDTFFGERIVEKF